MDHQAIFLLTIFAIVIYYIIAEFAWQLMKKQFRRRLLISALIAALLFTQIDFINLFTQTDAETVSAAEDVSVSAADIEVNDDMTELSSEAELPDGIEEQTGLGGGTAQGELTEELTENSLDDENSVENEIPAENETASADEAPTDGGSVSEGEIIAEGEGASVSETIADGESASESETTADEESASEDEITSEEEDELENNIPTEDENGTNKKLLIDEENTAEEKHKVYSFTSHTVHEGAIALFTADGVMLMGIIDNSDHNKIAWEPWEHGDKMPDKGGNYYLTQDVNFSGKWTVPPGITLCFNGKVIGGFEIEGTLIIRNCGGSLQHEKTYTITYNPGDGNGEARKQTVTKGEAATISDQPFEREGYKQIGWTTDKDGKDIKFKFGASYTGYEDITLYPVWEAKTYTITYDPGKHGSGKINPQTKTHGISINLSKEKFTREGYEQTGWATEDGAQEVEYIFDGTYTENKDITLYPVWQKLICIITYEPGTEEGTDGTAYKEEAKEGKAIISSKTFSRAGYKQTGWTTEEGGKDIEYVFGESCIIKDDITLYPVWQKLKCTITYEPGTEEGTEGTAYKESAEEGKAVISSKTFNRAGYKQTGWTTKEGGKDIEYGFGESCIIKDDITLYPVWDKLLYIITYEPGTEEGIAGTAYTEEAEEGKAVISTQPFSRAGYEQIGWTTKEGGKDIEYEFGESCIIKDDITLYPVWQELIYTITYELGKEVDVEGTAYKESTIEGKAIISSKTFNRAGYRQIGWTAKEDGKDIEYEFGKSYMIDNNLTLYPVWAATYIVTYHTNDENVYIDEIFKSYVYGRGLELPEPIKTGYTFGGWFEKDDFSGERVYSISATDKGDKEFYAKWTVNTYKVTYNKNNGTIDHESDYTSYTYGVGLKTLPKPTRNGYTFMGWYEDSSFKGAVVTGISTTATGNKTFYAKWSMDSTGDSNSNADSTATPSDNNSGSNSGDDSSSNKNVSGTTPTSSETDKKTGTTTEPAESKKKASSTGSKGTAGGTNTGTNKDADNDEVLDETKESEIITDGTDIISMGNGTVTITVISDEWKYGADVANAETAVNSILTPGQRQLAEDGETIDIRIVVKDISGNLPKEDKDVIENGLKAESESEEDDQLLPVEYIDISVYVKAGEDDWDAIPQTSEPIEIVLGISEELSDSETLYIARSHNGEYTLLDDLDSKPDTITIKTALFSTYAIVQPQIMLMADIPTNTDVSTEVITEVTTELSTDENENINAAASTDTAPIGTLAYSWMPVALCVIGILEIIGLILIFIFGKRLKEDKKYA